MKPKAIQRMNRYQVLSLKWVIRYVLAKTLRKGMSGTKGTLNVADVLVLGCNERQTTRKMMMNRITPNKIQILIDKFSS